MVPLAVVVARELLQDTPQMTVAEKDQATQALFFDRADERLCVGVAVRSLARNLNRSNAGVLQDALELCAELRVAVEDQQPVTYSASARLRESSDR